MANRRYTDDEVREILRLAAEPGNLPARYDPDGMSLADLESIGNEVGIAPAAIREAARALETRIPAPPRGGGLLGAPATAAYERTVRMRVTPEQHASIVLAIRRAMGRHGVVSGGPDVLEWRARDAGGGRYVTVQRIGDHTLIRAFGNYRDGVGVYGSLSASFGGISTLMLLKAAGLLLLPAIPLVVLAAWLPARLVWRRKFAAEDRLLRQTLAEVVAVLEDPDQDGER